jgi:virginiamycin B lyase
LLVTEFTVAAPAEGPYGVALGSGGTVDLGGAVTTYPLPTEKAGPVGISAGREAAWFVEILAGQAGRIDADGKLEEFPLPDRSAKPHAVVAIPDGGCW